MNLFILLKINDSSHPKPSPYGKGVISLEGKGYSGFEK